MMAKEKTSFSEAGIYEYRVAGCNAVPDDTDLVMLANACGGSWEIYALCTVHPNDPHMKHKGIADMNYAIFMKRIKGGG